LLFTCAAGFPGTIVNVAFPVGSDDSTLRCKLEAESSKGASFSNSQCANSSARTSMVEARARAAVKIQADRVVPNIAKGVLLLRMNHPFREIEPELPAPPQPPADKIFV
jgi:hypothetical protein